MEIDSGKKIVPPMEIVRFYVLDSIAAYPYLVREERAGYGTKKEETKPKHQLEGFPEHLLKLWSGSKKIVVYKDDAQFHRFVNDAVTIKKSKKEMYLGIIPCELAQRIKSDIERKNPDAVFELENYSCVLPSDTIRHALHEHGNEEYENNHGQRRLIAEDFLMVPKIIEEYDSVELSPKLYMGCPALIFKKVINGRTTLVTYVSKGRMNLTVETAWSGINKNGSISTSADEKSPACTS